MNNNDDADAWQGEPVDNQHADGGQGAASPPPDPAPAQTAPDPEPIPFEFRGTAGEYFKIWIVNLALTIFTLGIYSPWAKVRKLRYFYGNTYVDGSSFDFLGQPIAILKGRILAVVVFVIYWFASNFYPAANLVLLPVIAIFFPWVMIKSLAFRARNSAFRNLTFTYHGGYWQIAFAYFGLPLLLAAVAFVFYLKGAFPVFPANTVDETQKEMMLNFGKYFSLIMFGAMLAYPYFYYLQKRAFFAPRTFGDTPFAFDTGTRAFYNLFGAVFLLGILALVFIMITLSVSGMIGKVLGANGSVITILIALIVALPELFLFVAFITMMRNLIVNALRIGDAQLVSTLRIGEVFILYLTNIIAIFCSLGLLTPWAKVRLMRYQMEKTALRAPYGTENYIGAPGQSASAVGEELAEVFEMDLSI